MNDIQVPAEGRPNEAPGADALVGIDSNAFSVIGATSKLLRRAGASPEFIKAYQTQATAGSYDRLLAVSMAFLDAD